MQLDILSGVYGANGEYGDKYPINLMPVSQKTSVSNGFLRNVYGLTEFCDASEWGIDRGGINWKGIMYRALGQFLVTVDSIGNITKIGEIGNDNKLVSFAYSFDRIALVSNGKLFYFVDADNVFSEVTDPDLGVVKDIVWVDGYFVLCDDENIIVTDLDDPTSINPFKYGSSEVNPDDIISILKLKNEVVAINRYSIEFFSNVGGSGFPFQRVEGAMITRGAVGKNACCVYNDTITFLGNTENEQMGIYQAVNGQSVKISTKEIDDIIATYTEAQLTVTKLENIMFNGDLLLFVHFLNETWIYNLTASSELGKNLWCKASSFINGEYDYYDMQNLTYCYDKLIAGRRSNTGLCYIDANVATHWGNKVNWEFQTDILYNEGSGAIIHEMELQHNIKSLPLNNDAYIATEFSYDDGVTWSEKKYLNIGKQGRRIQKMRFLRNGRINTRRIQKFTGDSDAHLAISRLDIKAEVLAW